MQARARAGQPMSRPEPESQAASATHAGMALAESLSRPGVAASGHCHQGARGQPGRGGLTALAMLPLPVPVRQCQCHRQSPNGTIGRSVN